MKDKTFSSLVRRLAVFSVLIALIASVYAFEAATPQEASASSHGVQIVPPGWYMAPSGFTIGEQFRLIFLSSNKRNAEPATISTYNRWIRTRIRGGNADIREYSTSFSALVCTEDDDARDNTSTTYTDDNKGVPIYWLNGNKVADNYEDFYDGSWDNEVKDKNQFGRNGPNTAQEANYPWTGCEHDGTEAIDDSTSQALGNADESVRVGRPNSSDSGNGPLSSDGTEDFNDTRPMYGLSQVFEMQPPSFGELTIDDTPRSDTLSSSDTGQYWRVELQDNAKYRIDVKGSESSQYGGTLTNPWVKIFAHSDDIELLNDSCAGVWQNLTETVATAGGAGENSRLDIKVTGETKDYYLLVKRHIGDDGSYTITVNRMDQPQGRLGPDIEITSEGQTTIDFQWDEPAKTDNGITAPITGYKVKYRTLPDGSWSGQATKTEAQTSHEFTGLTQGQEYEVSVRSYHSDEDTNNTYQWGYATVYTDDCTDSGANACSIAVNSTKEGRINYDATSDDDSYTVRLVSGRTYVIRANGKATSSGTLVDPYLELAPASENTLVAEDDDGGRGYNSKITYSPTTTADYKIVVSSVDKDERGTYRVKVKER